MTNEDMRVLINYKGDYEHIFKDEQALLLEDYDEFIAITEKFKVEIERIIQSEQEEKILIRLKLIQEKLILLEQTIDTEKLPLKCCIDMDIKDIKDNIGDIEDEVRIRDL